MNTGIKVRLVSKGWTNFTGSLGFNALFEDGVSKEHLNARQIARIASSIRCDDVDTGEQVGPATAALQIARKGEAPVIKPARTQEEVEKDEADERERLAAEAQARKAEEEKALAEAQAKLEAEDSDPVVYSRQELEAIGAQDGGAGLRPIAEPLGVKGRSITDLVERILEAQSKAAAE